MSTKTKTKISPTSPRLTRAEIAGLPEAAPGLKYIAVGPYCWGTGKTAAEALRNARREGGAGLYTLHLVNEAAEVDGVNGSVFYNKSTPGILLNIGHTRFASY